MKVIVSCPGSFFSTVNGRHEQVKSTYAYGHRYEPGETEMDLDEQTVKKMQADAEAKPPRSLLKVTVVPEPKRK